MRPYDRPYKVLHLACAANCIAGTILAITQWKGGKEGNAKARLREYLRCPNSVRQKTPADDNEVRILQSQALVQLTAGTRLTLHEGFPWSSRC